MELIPVFNWPIYTINWGLKLLFHSEFNFVLTNFVVIPPSHPRYMFITIAPEIILDQNNIFIDTTDQYDGYVDINLLSPRISNKNWINDGLQKNNKPKVPVIGFVIPVNRNIYKPTIPKKLIIFGSRLGAPRDSARYKQFFALLAHNGNTIFYGPSRY